MLRKPRGTRDFLPQDMVLRRQAEGLLRKVALNWGYEEVKTPTFEHLELFTIKSGEAIVGEIYDFEDKSGRKLALRPELTAPVVRLYLESMSVAPRPLRLFYFDNCFRYERPQRGRFREFWQFGVELVGSPYPEADAEVISLAMEMLDALQVEGDLHIGHLGVLRSLLTHLDPEVQTKIMRLVDKKDHQGLERLLGEIDPGLASNLLSLIELTGEEAIPGAKRLLGDLPSLDQLGEVLEFLDRVGVEYTVDFGIARGLDYYTGTVFEIYASGLGAQNQVCGGGSYRLAKLFGGGDTPSTGFALGFDRLMEVCPLEPPEEKMVCVVCFEDTRLEAFRIARELRRVVPTRVDVMRRKFKDQLSHASHASYAVIVGSEELERGVVSLKNLETGEQKTLPLEEVIKILAK